VGTGAGTIDEERTRDKIPFDAESDQRAVGAVLAGDRDAFRILVERESGQVIRACNRILGDIHEAEDAAQEAFVIAFRSLAGWRGDGPFGAWLARIAVRIALRQAARRKVVAWIDPMQADSAPAGEMRDRGARSVHASLIARAAALASVHDPASIAIRAERASLVRAAVARLDEPYREIVALRFFADLSLNEIAAETGRPLGTVKTHLHRGLLRMRGLIDAAEAAP
jgi:RNA polymerase sigma-70 factor (ECF subfamily)